MLREFQRRLRAERVGPRAERLAPRRVLGAGALRDGPGAALQAAASPTTAFARRIMFPLTDMRGRVLGFGARAMRADQRPKYLNTRRQRHLPQGSPPLRRDIWRARTPRAPAR